MKTETLVADLVRPEAYPGRVRRVSLETTHISHVFLTEREAWKVKRPVDFGFLDFTTVAKRRHFCREEVRQNRDLAPGVYVGVVPVRRGAKGHTFRGGGAVADWAVRMKRLPDRASALRLVERGRLTFDHLSALARQLAPFYAKRRATPALGTPSAIRVNVRENFDQVDPFVGRFVPARRFRSVRAWQERFLETHANVLRSRARHGRIREGHGDLRLEHVYFTPDPTVIDCIEFNERFRCGDVASDVAFLAMELVQHGRLDLAAWFLDRVALETGDVDLFSVVDFYMSYRAWVRGKVACFVAADPSTPPEKSRRKAGEAAACFALAEACTRPPWEKPRVIVVAGQVGSGKSTVAEALGRALGYPIVSSDATRKSLAGLAPRDPGPPRIYAPFFSFLTFRELFRRARIVLNSGRGVILDATFGRRSLREEARRFAGRLPFVLVEARCDEALALRRIRRRALGPSVSDAGAETRGKIGRGFEPISELPARAHVVVDTTRRPASWLRGLLSRLPQVRV